MVEPQAYGNNGRMHHFARRYRPWAYADQRLRDHKQYVNQRDLFRTVIFNAVDASLGHLKTSQIYLLRIYRYDYNTPTKETAKALGIVERNGQYLPIASTVPLALLHARSILKLVLSSHDMEEAWLSLDTM
ncbi:hypothetical protein PQX77_010892 [Marasmius sp. AFHP31]|nr:hypothetical protein PQX77_010892 [Marasmius sp. AFHP31]